MAEGYEGWIVLREQYLGWGTTSAQDTLALLEPESETLSFGPPNAQVRTNKLRGERYVQLQQVTTEFFNPSGGIVLQPRTSELPGILMSHYQIQKVSGTSISSGTWTGTLQFVPADISPDFSQGSAWGTFATGASGFDITTRNMYCLTVQRIYGTLNELTAQAFINYNDGYAERLDWSLPFDGDLVLTADFNFRGTRPAQADLSNSANPETYNISSQLRLSAPSATISWDGTANHLLDIEEWGLTTVAGGVGKGRVGGYGFQKFPFANTPSDEGRFRLELIAAKMVQRAISGTGTFSLTTRVQVPGESEWIEFDQPYCVFTSPEPTIGGAESPIDNNVTYQAFGSGGTPSTRISLYTSYATANWSVDVGTGVLRS